ncbi:MAG: translocation/assembly module TamB, partial [Gemmatimonadetes bacterium]|nr:translocation/assembly module TamB [Gemmatimonadota bacterium]
QLDGPVRITIDSARVRGLPIEASRIDMMLAGGIARIDTVMVRGPGLDVVGSGAIGLDREHGGRLALRVSSASLAPLEVWRFGSVADPTEPRVRGTVDGHAMVTGSIESLAVEATATLDRIGWEDHRAQRIALELNATGLRSDSADWRLSAALDSLLIGGRQADSARLAIAAAADLMRFEAEAWMDTVSALRGAGSWAATEEGGLLRVTELSFRSQDRDWRLADLAVIHLAGGVARVEPARILPSGGSGLLGVEGTIALFGVDSTGVADALDFDVELSRIPFGDFVSIARSPIDAGGVLDATLRVTGTTARPLIDGEVVIRDLEFEGATLERVTLSVDYADRNLQASAAALQAGREVMVASARIPLDLARARERRPDLPLSLTLRMDSFPAAFAMAPLPGFSGLEGVVDGTIDAGGTTRAPTLNGTLLLRRGAATWDVTGVRYVDVEGTLRSDQDLVVSVDLSARTIDARGRTPGAARDGGVRVTGRIDLEQPSNPGLDLDISANHILAARRRDADLITSGQLDVTGQYRRPTIGGSVTIDGGNLYLDELYRRYLIVQLEDPLLFNLVDTSLVSVRRVLPPSQSPFVRNLRIDNVNVTVSAGSWLRSREMDVEVTGDLIVYFDRQEEDLRLSGTLNAVRGTYRLEYPPFARIFEVEGGTVEFPGTPGIDPILDIVASHTARTRDEPLRIEAVLTGSLQNPRVRLRSDAEPPIAESDLASYLFFGAPTYGIASSPGSGSVFGSIGRQALTATGLGYVASGLQTLAQSLGIVDYVGLTAAEAAGPGRQSTFENLLSSTRIELGRYLSPRVFVAYTQRLGSPANDAGVRLEWRYHPTYTLEVFAEDRFARAPAVSLSQAIAARKVYGFLIYREWGY